MKNDPVQCKRSLRLWAQYLSSRAQYMNGAVGVVSLITWEIMVDVALRPSKKSFTWLSQKKKGKLSRSSRLTTASRHRPMSNCLKLEAHLPSGYFKRIVPFMQLLIHFHCLVDHSLLQVNALCLFELLIENSKLGLDNRMPGAISSCSWGYLFDFVINLLNEASFRDVAKGSKTSKHRGNREHIEIYN